VGGLARLLLSLSVMNQNTVIHSVKVVLLAFLLSAPLRAFSSDPVPADRLPYGGSWAGIAGVSGGIPNRTQIYTTLTSGATVSQINAAIASCPSNSVVHLPAGTYNINNYIYLQRDGVTLRGDTDANGVPTTVFNCSQFQAVTMGSTGWDTSAPANWHTANVTGGISRGSTTVTLDTIPTGCIAGALLWFSAPVGGAIDGGSFALFLGTDPYIQIVKVTAVNGNSVSFYPAINADYLTTLKASTSTRPVYHRMGLENIKMQGGQLVYVESLGTDECWIKNCILSNSPSGQVRQLYLYTVNRFEIRHCDFGTIDAASSDAYSIFAQDCTGVLTEDNYFHNSPNFYPQMGAQNCVFSYNFITNCPYSAVVGWLSQIVYNHGAHNCYNLYEGNIVPTYYDDGLLNNVHDPVTTRCNTHLRDRMVGWDGSDGGKIYNCHGITILDPGVNHVIAGCVIGRVGFTDQYNAGSGSSMTKACYDFETGVSSTVGRYGNWNAVNQGVNASEALAAGQVIANSYLYSSAPSWFGNLTWPPIDPSRTSNAQLSATNIPAGYRAIYVVDPPSGAPDVTPPSAPTALAAAAAGTNQMNLSWSASTDNVGVTGYLIERQGPASTNFVQVGTSAVATYVDTGLAAGTSYSYRVRAKDGVGNLSVYSSVVSAATLAPDSQAPTAPATLMAAAAGSTQINVSWTASTDNVGVTRYAVERSQGAGSTSFTQIATLAGTNASDTGLAPSTVYNYRVRATDAVGNLGPYSSIASATTAAAPPDQTAPTAPGNLAASTVSSNQINLSWTASTDNVGVTGYLVERAQGSGSTSFTQVGTASGTSFSDSGLAASTVYNYRVRATDAVGNLSAYSSAATASTTSASIPVGLVVGYGFDAGTGSTVADSSGNADTGSLNGASWTTSGKYGNALSFDGLSSFVDLGNPTPLHSTGSMTWSAWVMATGDPRNDGQIIAKSDSGSGLAGWQFKTSPDTGVETFSVGVSADGNSRVQRYSQTVRSLNTWYYVAGVYDASAQRLDIYVNGALDNGMLNGTVPTSQFDPNLNVTVGKRSGGYYFQGVIDEVRVYNRALSASEIQSNMNTPVSGALRPLPPAGLHLVGM
jgi:chitodextrinase